MTTQRCGAYKDPLHPTAHTCPDPLECSLAALVDDDDPTEVELGRLHAVLDRVEDLCDRSRAKVAANVLAEIHLERGGPS